MLRSTHILAAWFGCALSLCSTLAMSATAIHAPPATPGFIVTPRAQAGPSESAVATASVVAMAAGHWADATHGFDGVMHNALTPPQLQQIWQQLVAKYGPYAGAGKAIREPAPSPYQNIVVPVTFGKQTLEFQYTFDASGQVGGLHLLPLHMEPMSQ